MTDTHVSLPSLIFSTFLNVTEQAVKQLCVRASVRAHVVVFLFEKGHGMQQKPVLLNQVAGVKEDVDLCSCCFFTLNCRFLISSWADLRDGSFSDSTNAANNTMET